MSIYNLLPYSIIGIDCRGPAPVDPGTSKLGQRWRGKTYLFINIRLNWEEIV